MSISNREIPFGTEVDIWSEPVMGRPGIVALSPKIACIFARWSVLEKQLNQMFTLITDADPLARTEFDSLTAHMVSPTAMTPMPDHKYMKDRANM